MQAEDLKGWLAAVRRGDKERETATKDGGRVGKEITVNAGWRLRRTVRGSWSWYKRHFGTGNW